MLDETLCRTHRRDMVCRTLEHADANVRADIDGEQVVVDGPVIREPHAATRGVDRARTDAQEFRMRGSGKPIECDGARREGIMAGNPAR